MELTTLITEIRARLGEAVEDFWKDTDITRAINEAQRRFASEEKWAWLFTTGTASLLSGEDELIMQTGISWVNQFDIMLSNGDSTYPLLPIRLSPAEGFKARQRYFNITGFPNWYYLEKQVTTDESGAKVYTSTIRFIPASSDNYDVEFQYLRVPTDLINSNDIPDVPENYQGALVAWATAQLWMKELNGGSKAQEQIALYQKILSDAQAEQRSLAIDEVVAWGKEEPEVMSGATDWAGRLPTNLGQ